MKGKPWKKFLLAGFIGGIALFPWGTEAAVVTDRVPMLTYADHTVPTYEKPGGGRKGFISPNVSLVKIEEIRPDGWAKGTYPISGGKRVRRWFQMRELQGYGDFQNYSTSFASDQIVYRTSAQAAKTGKLLAKQEALVVGAEGDHLKIIYRVNGGSEWKMGWVYQAPEPVAPDYGLEPIDGTEENDIYTPIPEPETDQPLPPDDNPVTPFDTEQEIPTPIDGGNQQEVNPPTVNPNPPPTEKPVIKYMTNGWYRLVNPSQSLTLQEGRLQWSEYTGAKQQKFYLRNMGNGNFILRAPYGDAYFRQKQGYCRYLSDTNPTQPGSALELTTENRATIWRMMTHSSHGSYMEPANAATGNFPAEGWNLLPVEAPREQVEYDINGDKTIDEKDSALIKDYLSAISQTITDKADVDRNGQVSVNDLTKLDQIITPKSSTEPEPARVTMLPIRGDVNGDGQVDAADRKMLTDYQIGNINTLPVTASGDLNGDGLIDLSDTIAIKMLLLSGNGDVNGDGSIDARDLLNLAEYLAGRRNSLQTTNADINRDGILNRADLTALIRAIRNAGRGCGDLNGDGKIDGTDLSLMKKSMNPQSLLNNRQADLDNDGKGGTQYDIKILENLVSML